MSDLIMDIPVLGSVVALAMRWLARTRDSATGRSEQVKAEEEAAEARANDILDDLEIAFVPTLKALPQPVPAPKPVQDG
ncbi:hypothetical protein F5Y18DRAFT_425447 [Xylariaceae sp. FL1019]|nr:hypothetical protein F5Y18DRAFT_425447 [Xylariaceae sp. FL1019]